MAILGSYVMNEKIVSRDILPKIFTILNFLITKVKLTSEEAENDITKRKDLLFCLIKLSEQETDPEVLEKELILIGFLLKINFNNVSVDYETDEDITDICLREVKNPKNDKCFSNAIKVLGILGSQGIVTLSHS